MLMGNVSDLSCYKYKEGDSLSFWNNIILYVCFGAGGLRLIKRGGAVDLCLPREGLVLV